MGELKKIKTLCGICPWGCGIIVYVKDGKAVKAIGDPDYPWNHGKLCTKASGMLDYVYSPDRLKYPMKKVAGEFVRTSWDEALDTIAFQMNKVKETDGARSWALLEGMPVVTQGFNSMRFAQRFCDFYGSPNYMTPESYCFLSIITANMVTLGKFPSCDAANSKCILLWGHNPSDGNFFHAMRIRQAKEKGAKLLVIDPRMVPLAKEADIYTTIRPGTDAALMLAMLNVIISEELYDKEFVEKWTTGFDLLRDRVRDYTPEKVETITWVSKDLIESLARTFASIRPATIVAGINALSQCASGYQTWRGICILLAITGNLDVPGGYIDVDLGGTNDVASNPTYMEQRIDGMQTEPSIGQEQYPLFVQGWTGQGNMVWDQILTGEPYPIKMMQVIASNPLLTWPNSNKIRKALERLDFLVVSGHMMNETAQLADIVLPACSFLERMETWEALNFCFNMPYVGLRNKVIGNYYEAKSDIEYYLSLGKRLGYTEGFPWNSVEEWMEWSTQPSPFNLHDYLGKTNLIPCGVMKWKQYETEGFKTPSGKVEISSSVMGAMGLDPLPSYIAPDSTTSSPEETKEYPVILITGERYLQFLHSSFRELTKFRKRVPEPFAKLHPDTAKKYNIIDGEWMMIESKTGSIEIKASVTEDIARNVLSVPHGWAQSNCNALTDNKSVDPITGYPSMRVGLCKIAALKK